MDEPAITPIRKKRRSSLRLCAELVKDGPRPGHGHRRQHRRRHDRGQDGDRHRRRGRPAGAGRRAAQPRRGARSSSTSAPTWTASRVHLREFAVMGHFYAQEVIGTPSPRIGLLSIGEEEGKGTDLHPRGLQGC